MFPIRELNSFFSGRPSDRSSDKLIWCLLFAAQDPLKYDNAQQKEAEKSPLEQTTAVVVRGMRGMSSMGKPVSMRPIGEAGGAPHGSAKMSPTPAESEFMCTCPTGWTGPTCEISKLYIDEQLNNEIDDRRSESHFSAFRYLFENAPIAAHGLIKMHKTAKGSIKCRQRCS